MGLLGVLSGELDGLVDALITNATPVDGSRSRSLVDYIEQLPPRFRDIGYALKELPNGNSVVDGKVMSWVFKLRSIGSESPLTAFYNDLLMYGKGSGMPKMGKTAAAVQHWLTFDRRDLPLEITKLSHLSYTRPITDEGEMPVKLFGRSLNLKRINEKGIKWLICIAEQDDLTDEGTTLAALDYVDAEIAVFPKGHAAMATSWSDPRTEYALHKKFESKSFRFKGKYRGPVRFQLDLDGESCDIARAA
jgi:hypothetical protein